jgi:Rrf2 family cysteine metabolism transcriptional repressor
VFTISARGIYGLTAMLELGRRYRQGPTQIKEIASSHEIPQHYLEQLLVILKKAGFVESSRGPQGGYTLARRPGEIQVLDILATLDGRLEIVREGNQSRTLMFFWERLDREIKKILTMSLEELIYEKQRSEQQIVYNI